MSYDYDTQRQDDYIDSLIEARDDELERARQFLADEEGCDPEDIDDEDAEEQLQAWIDGDELQRSHAFGVI